MGHPARKAGRSSSGGSTLGVKVGLLFIPLRASVVGRRPHPHRTGATCLASTKFWSLATGPWHKANGSFLFSRVLPQSHCSRFLSAS